MVLTLGDVDRMPREPGTLPNDRVLLRQEPGHLPANQLVGHGLLAVGVQLARVADLPGPRGVVVGHGLAGGCQLGALRVEAVAVGVLGASDRCVGCFCVADEDGVFAAVDVGVYAEAEEVLVVVGVDAWTQLAWYTQWW